MPRSRRLPAASSARRAAWRGRESHGSHPGQTAGSMRCGRTALVHLDWFESHRTCLCPHEPARRCCEARTSAGQSERNVPAPRRVADSPGRSPLHRETVAADRPRERVSQPRTSSSDLLAAGRRAACPADHSRRRDEGAVRRCDVLRAATDHSVDRRGKSPPRSPRAL